MMKKIIYLMSFVILAYSCDDAGFEERQPVDTGERIEVEATIALTRNIAGAAITSNNAPVQISYDLSQSFANDVSVEIRAISKISLEPGSGFFEEFSYFTVPAGTTSGTALFTMPGDPDFLFTYEGRPSIATVQLTGVRIIQPEDEDPDDDIEPEMIPDPFVLESNVLELDGWDDNVWVQSADQILFLSLDWLGPYGGGENDLDLFVVDTDGNVFESSTSGDRFEGDFFNNPANEAHPDGTYDVLIDVWTAVDMNPVPWRLTLSHPDGRVDVYEGFADSTTGTINPVSFVKSSDSEGNASYVTSAN